MVGFFPSDHHISDEEAFAAHINLGFEAAESGSEPVVLLGIKPSNPETEYGWIEPGTQIANNPSVFHVRRFWEKPSPDFAAELMERGGLWNSFVMLGRIESYLNLMHRALPHLVSSFESIQPTFFTGAEREALLDLYSGIPASDFSQQVLSAHPRALAVLPARHLGWSDLGDAARVLSVLERRSATPAWATRSQLAAAVGE